MTGASDEQGIAAAYDRWAQTYESEPNRTRELAASVLREHGPALDGRDLVEVGCGTGYNTAWFDERARSVVAMDFSEGMLRQAQTRVRSPRVRFVRHDIRERWPVEDASADLVVDVLVLEHVEQFGPVFAEAVRVLRPGGELFVCELHPFRQIAGRQAEFTSPETGECVRVAAFIHDVSEYVNTALAAGFALLHVGEWRDEGVALPRLLSIHAERP
jgi:ubiquinone/menaquinone biosynthesis C-methylase UbiE